MHVTLSIPQESDEAIQWLMGFTGRSGDFAGFVQDALRVYEWVLYQQVQGRTLTGLEPIDLQVLTGHPTLEGERDILVDCICPEFREALVAYFTEHAASKSKTD